MCERANENSLPRGITTWCNLLMDKHSCRKTTWTVAVLIIQDRIKNTDPWTMGARRFALRYVRVAGAASIQSRNRRRCRWVGLFADTQGCRCRCGGRGCRTEAAVFFNVNADVAVNAVKLPFPFLTRYGSDRTQLRGGRGKIQCELLSMPASALDTCVSKLVR